MWDGTAFLGKQLQFCPALKINSLFSLPLLISGTGVSLVSHLLKDFFFFFPNDNTLCNFSSFNLSNFLIRNPVFSSRHLMFRLSFYNNTLSACWHHNKTKCSVAAKSPWTRSFCSSKSGNIA